MPQTAMTTVGPFGQRRTRLRCVACARRKIKCEGCTPCVYCVKKGLECTPQATSLKTGAVFIHSSFFGENSCQGTHLMPSSRTAQHAPMVGGYLSMNDSLIFAREFFAGFLLANDFGSTLDLKTISAHFQTSSSLHHALISIGALHLNRKRANSHTPDARGARLGALTAYRTSVIGLRTAVSADNIEQVPATLWTTFFLGLFELMFDDTGEGFVKHFLYGTSRILQHRRPDAHQSGPGRSFFLTVRVFEICRSLIYSKPTFFAQTRWNDLMMTLYDDSGVGWHPKEKLFDLMIQCSDLSNRVFEVLEPNPVCPDSLLDTELQGFAVEGLALRCALNTWCTLLKSTSPNMHALYHEPQSLLAKIYFHAISIYLSGIFDYRPQFNHTSGPSLPQIIIQHHVDMILSLIHEALKRTTLGGVLFFLPLRVAGARVNTKIEAGEILRMLEEISMRSFTVADAFVLDLKELWNGKGVM